MNDDQKFEKMTELYNQVNDYFLHRFMKLSRSNMDMKIQVLQDRLDGKTPPEIPNWDAVQECD